MVETYNTDEERIYYVLESIKGTTPGNPAMLGVPHDSLNPGVNPNNILLRSGGSYDLLDIKRGIRVPTVKFGYIIPSAAPIELMQHVKRELDSTLSVQVLYHKSAFATATDILSLLYTYMRIAKLTVSCDIDDVVKAVMELTGQQLVTGTSKITGATYTDHSGAIAFNETDVKFGGVANDRVVGWKFEVNNNPRQVPVISSTNGHIAKYVPFGNRQLRGEVHFEFESKAEMDAALADSSFDIDFGFGGTNHATLQACKWGNIQHEKWLEDLISVRAPFDAKGPLLIAAV